MTKRHIAECFKKSVTRSNNILTDIWHDTIVYHLLVINDIVQHKSYEKTSLNSEEVRRIHKRNAKHSLQKTSCNKVLEQDNDQLNMFVPNFNLQDVSGTRPKNDVPMFMSPLTLDTLMMIC